MSRYGACQQHIYPSQAPITEANGCNHVANAHSFKQDPSHSTACPRHAKGGFAENVRLGHLKAHSGEGVHKNTSKACAGVTSGSGGPHHKASSTRARAQRRRPSSWLSST